MSESTPLALDGVRVVSFGAFVAGCTVAVLLAELGADVVKVEARSRPEVLRMPAYAIGPPFVEPSGVPNTVMYGALSRSLRSISLDLEHSEARSLFHRLVANSDVVIENFAGETMAKWGCAFMDLIRDNPRLVMLSMSGYGRTGPCVGYRAYASNICGFIGLTSAWGYSAGTLSDYVAATTAALGIVAALRQVRRIREPIHLDVAQIDAMTALMAPLYLGPLVNNVSVLPEPNEMVGSWLSGVFAAVGHDCWVAIDLEDGGDWKLLCEYLHRTDLLASNVEEARSRRAELEGVLARWFAERSPHTAMHLLQKEGLAVGVVQNIEDVWRDPQLRSASFMVPLHQPEFGMVSYPRPSHRLSRTPARIRTSPARLGQHTEQVLEEWLAISSEQLADLEGSGAVFQAPGEAVGAS